MDRFIEATLAATLCLLIAACSILADIPPRPYRAAVEVDQTASRVQSDPLWEITQAIDAEPGITATKAREWAGWIQAAADEYGVPSPLLVALVKVESHFQPGSVSARGAVGPAQVRPLFHAERCGGDLHDPKQNIRCAARVLVHYYASCGGTWADALACYNVGPTGRFQPGGPEAAARYIAKIEAAQSAALPPLLLRERAVASL